MDKTSISYTQSQVLRGIAIVMMVFLHCFNYYPQNDYVDVLIGKSTLSWWMTHTAGLCVPLYCMLSGYGLYKKYPYPFDYCKNKVWYLSCRYWFFLTVFFVIGLSIGFYEFNISTFFSNFLGYKTTYNPTLWFLLPYIIVFISSPILLKVLKKDRLRESIVIVTILFLLSSSLLKIESMGKINLDDCVHILLESLRLLFSFMCGAVLAKKGVLKLRWMKSEKLKNVLLLLILMVLFVSRALIQNQIFAPFFCLVLIVILLNLKYSSKLENILVLLGNHSLNIWFIHAYFTYEYLKFTVYWLHYPIFIFLAVLIFSYFLSYLTNILFNRLNINK